MLLSLILWELQRHLVLSWGDGLCTGYNVRFKYTYFDLNTNLFVARTDDEI